MIQVQNKSECCGCSACANICPKDCISLLPDSEGFSYPKVDTTLCIDCGLCEKVCPVINQDAPREPLKVYAAKLKDVSLRHASSSGGIFSALAIEVIQLGGVVFGAVFDEDWQVHHSYTEHIDGLAAMRGSKYVQSRIGDSYQQTKRFLEQDRPVLFCGTQCQIAGLNRFLRKHYPKLLTLEVICHGAPSPKVWQNYLKAHKGISGINFRSKKNGWKTYSFEIYSSTENITEYFGKNTYMQAFLSNLSLRPSCYACPAKSGKSGADITLGDFWGIDRCHPEFDDDKGCSAVMLNTEKGEKWFNTIYKQLHVLESTYNNVLYGNASLEQSVKEPIYHRYFFHLLRKGAPLETIINKITSKNLYLRICRVIYRKFGI